MALYAYEILDKKGESTGKIIEIFQKMTEDHLTHDPETGSKIRRVICLSFISDSRPAWDRSEDIRRFINKVKPKYIRDEKSGIRKRLPKGGV